MQLCPQCNTNNRDTAHHCAQCGHGLQHLLGAGTILQGRYQIERVLGTGGFGAVYLVRHTTLGQHYALKTLFDRLPTAVRQFEREATFLASLHHHNVANVSDFFVEPDGAPYILMEYVEGENLDHLITRIGPRSLQEVLRWIEQVLDALQYLHTRTPSVIHRDIKPNNLILQAGGRLVLVDFGIAKESDTKTTIGAQGYTFGFSSPEQFRGQTDTRSDLYSVGATMFFLLTAEPPPDAIDRLQGTALVLPTRLSQPVIAVLASALAMDPSQRPPTAQAFKDALVISYPQAAVPQVVPLTSYPQVAVTQVVPPPTSYPATTSRFLSLRLVWALLSVLIGVLIVFVATNLFHTRFGGSIISSNQTATAIPGSTKPTLDPQQSMTAIQTVSSTRLPETVTQVVASVTTIPETTISPLTSPIPVNIAIVSTATPTIAEERNLSMLAQASASSELAPEQTTRFGLVRYDPANTLDRDPATSWVEGVDGPGIGEKLILVFPHPVTVTRLGLDVGFDRDERIFFANNRVRQVQLAFTNASGQTLDLLDQRGLQYMPLTPVLTTSLTIIITNIYPGTKYNDTAIAEVEVWGYEGP